MNKSDIPPLPTKQVGNPYKNAFHHFHNSNIHQNKLNNSISLIGGNSLFTKQTVPQVNTGMPPSVIDANNQAVNNSGSLLQIKANSVYDSCLTNPNCGTNNHNQKGGKNKYSKRNNSKKNNSKRKKFTKKKYNRKHKKHKKYFNKLKNKTYKKRKTHYKIKKAKKENKRKTHKKK
jgi:hypothetical protein